MRAGRYGCDTLSKPCWWANWDVRAELSPVGLWSILILLMKLTEDPRVWRSARLPDYLDLVLSCTFMLSIEDCQSSAGANN